MQLQRETHEENHLLYKIFRGIDRCMRATPIAMVGLTIMIIMYRKDPQLVDNLNFRQTVNLTSLYWLLRVCNFIP